VSVSSDVRLQMSVKTKKVVKNEIEEREKYARKSGVPAWQKKVGSREK
jgi:hypothetical protein